MLRNISIAVTLYRVHICFSLDTLLGSPPKVCQQFSPNEATVQCNHLKMKCCLVEGDIQATPVLFRGLKGSNQLCEGETMVLGIKLRLIPRFPNH